jgi:hypothetical protein
MGSALVACLAIGVAFPDMLMTGVLSLYLVPKPVTLLLLGAGVAVLAILGLKKRPKA